MTTIPFACSACFAPTTRSVAFLDNDRTEVTAGWCGSEKCIVEIGEREARVIAAGSPFIQHAEGGS